MSLDRKDTLTDERGDNVDEFNLAAHQVAPVFREPFIFTGYRLSNQPWSYYWRSLLHVHNETGNVWSHILASVVVLQNIVGFYNTFDIRTDKYAWSTLAFSVGLLAGTVCSSIAHNFHTKSVWWHYVLFMMDYAGVTLYTFGTGLGCIYICSEKRVYSLVEPYFVPLNVFFSWFTFYNFCQARLSCTSSHSRHRRMILVIFVYAALISIPVLSRHAVCLATSGCSIASLNHITSCFLLLGLSCVLFAAHVPESFAPGKFDLIGNGHFLFHCTCIWTLSTQCSAVHQDIREGAAAHTNPSPVVLILAYVVLILMQTLTVVSLRRDIAHRVHKELKDWESKTSKRS